MGDQSVAETQLGEKTKELKKWKGISGNATEAVTDQIKKERLKLQEELKKKHQKASQ